MPATLEAAIVFTLAIAPGYLFIRGFSVGRTQVPPERDLYVLAEAIVASVVWLAALFLLWHERAETYGLLPRDDAALRAHEQEVTRLLLFVVVAPYVAGRFVGWGQRLFARVLPWALERVDRWLGRRTGKAVRPAGWGRWLVAKLAGGPLLTPPTAWDRAWIAARDGKKVATVHLKDGGYVRGPIGSVDLSPLPNKVELASGEGFDEDGLPHALASGPGGVYLDGGEVRAVYFEDP